MRRPAGPTIGTLTWRSCVEILKTSFEVPMTTKELPQYEPDGGALIPAQLEQISQLAGKVDTSFVRSSLFGDDSG